MSKARRVRCGYSAHRLGIPCRFCEPTRLQLHESSCSGLRAYWHTLNGEHVRIAEWDYQEASWMAEKATDRYLRLWPEMEELLN